MSSFSSPSLPLYKSPPPFSPKEMSKQKNQPPPMAGEGKWETFTDDNDDDSLSLIDLPINTFHNKQEDCKSSVAIEEFEFRTFGGGGSLPPKADMCAADEIFFKGQLLPSFRQSSVGSQSCPRSNSNCYSSSGSSSGCISRSHSSSSNSSNCEPQQRRVSVSNNFYAHPSPKPQLRTSSIGSAARRSTGSAPPGWALFRLGLVKTPEIELSDLRSRRMRANEFKSGVKKERKHNMPVALFGCNCGQDAVQPMPVNRIRALPTTAGKKEEIMWRSRMSEWLEELSIGTGV